MSPESTADPVPPQASAASTPVDGANEVRDDEPKDEGSLDSYRLIHPLDICSVLQDLRRGRNVLTARWGAGPDQQMLTTVVSVDNAKQEWAFEPSTKPEVNRMMSAAKAVAFAGAASGIRVRFVTPPPREARLADGPALVGPLPASLIRLQMRRHFRAVAQKTNPYGCVTVMANGEERELHLHDISLGGVGLRARDISLSVLPVGTVLDDALLSFGELGSLQIALRVMSQRVVELPAGTINHFGCQFVNPGRSDEPFIQRVIYHLELLRRNGV